MTNLDKENPQQNVNVPEIPVLDMIAPPPPLPEYSSDFPQLQGQLVSLPQLQIPASKGNRKQKFTPEEDDTLKQLVAQYGQDWKMISAVLKNRSARQCRDRWKHYLSPDVSRRPWTPDEDRLLVEKFREYGRQWAVIAKFFPERTDIHIKNRWATLSPKLGYTNAAQQEELINQNEIAQIDPTQTPQQHDLLKLEPQ